MRKGLSAKVLVPLVLTTLIPGLAFIALSKWLTERVFVDYFRQRANEIAWNINEEFYHYYFDKWYAVEGEAFDPLDRRHRGELDALIARNMRSFHLERINFYNTRGKIIYSTTPQLVGLSAAHLPQIQKALKGQVVSQIVYNYQQDIVRRPLHPALKSDVIEIYIPMICLNPHLPIYRQQVGVIEIYQDVNVVRRWISRIQNYLGGMMATVLALAIISAFSALRRVAIKPLHRMMAGIEASVAVSDGRLVMNKIEGEETYELRSLADSFNRMAQDVIEKSCQLEALGHQHRTIVEASQDCIMLCDAEGRCLNINPNGAHVLELDSSGDVIGLSYLDIWGEPYRSRANEALQEVLRGKPVVFEAEAPTQKTGMRKWWHVILSPVCDDHGAVTHFIGVSRDITDHKRAEEERTALQGQLLRSQRMEATGRLAGGIAHDFNNLLTVIISYSELLSRRLGDESPLRRDTEQILRAGHRAADLTRQLLAFSRKQVMEPRVLDLNQVLTDLSKMLRRVIGEDIDLGVTLSADLGRVRADPGQIEQVIVNLVVNARDAMPGGGRLTLETANMELDEEYAGMVAEVTPGGYVQLTVSDTGCGMTEEVMTHLFEPFFTTKGEGKGTGLGLSTVYGIIKQHGGHIGVYSEPGKGSSFKIYLPRVDEPAKPMRGPVSEELPRGGETILLVEDEEVVRTVATRMLGDLGYRVVPCGSAEDAIEHLNAHKVAADLLLTDIILPGINGKDLAGRIRAVHPEIKVLYVSGYAGDTIAHQGVLDPGSAFLQKPFNLSAVARKVREVLDGHPPSASPGRHDQEKL